MVRGHGRIVLRFIRGAPAPEGLDFPHAAQVVVVQREVADLVDLVISTETAFYVTRFSAPKPGTERAADLVRGHWTIENGLHSGSATSPGFHAAASGRYMADSSAPALALFAF